MSRYQRFARHSGNGGFHLSIGDIMAALLLVVVLFLVVTIQQLGATVEALAETTSTIEDIAADYQNTRQAIVDALIEEFEDDFQEWGAELLKDTLTVRFSEAGTFAPNQANLTPRFQSILQDFVPRYLGVLYQPEFREYITDVLVEGHTANPGNAYEFVTSMNLAYGRSLAVLAESYESYSSGDERSRERDTWVQSRLGVAGYSHGRPVPEPPAVPDWGRSRRVDFRVITNADAQLERILESVGNE